MKTRLTGLLPVLFFLSTAAFARVLSYAPYTDRVATPGFHERTSRHFLLIERSPSNDQDRELVLYDTRGGEPRTILQKTGSGEVITSAALFEPQVLLNLDPPPPQPPPYVIAFLSGNPRKTVFSRDGGETWKEVTAVRGYQPIDSLQTIDYGGPWTQGLESAVRIGNEHYPFIATYAIFAPFSSSSTWKIDPSGAATHIGDFRVIGQNKTATKLLGVTSEIDNNQGFWVFHRVDVATGAKERLGRVHNQAAGLTGWIGPDETHYIQFHRPEGRFLYQHRGQGLEFIAGPQGAAPPMLESQYVYTPALPPRHELSFFAVPPHDFNGAWMIQRDPGKPTNLLRYTPIFGRQQMWSDVSGPEVEALIPGGSGNTVLIQVHRDRSDAMQRAFIDPALAVWRVGEPMPREYDELFLNEERSKGFLHVDVDKMAAGDPFVFNSGAVEDSMWGGPISPPIGGGGDVVQEWGVVRGSLKQRLVLPGVARLRGAFESHWLTDVTIYNPLAVQQNVEIRYVALGEAATASARRTVTLTLQPREIRFVPDALQALFSVEAGGGALHLLPDVGVNAVARTYSRSGAGTYGFSMQAIDLYNAASVRFPVTFSGAFPGENFRTNILLTDTSGRGSTASLQAYGVMGRIGNSTTSLSAPHDGILQSNGIGAQLGLFSRDAGALRVQPTRGTAIATVVAIDNSTNDPTYFPPDVAAGGADTIRAIPVIGHLDGTNGARFRSDVYLFNPTENTRTVTLEVKAWDSQASRTTSFTLLPREARVVVDALPTLFQMTGLARLRYWSNDTTKGAGVRVTSRTYTIDARGATYGSLIPPLNNFQVAASGDALEILGMSAGSGFRTNLGLVELSPPNQSGPPVQVRVRLLDHLSKELDSFVTEVPRAGGRQLNDIFAARMLPPGSGALIIVEVLQGGLIGAYATLTDNLTNDTAYLGAQLAAQQ
jgi:hypothetical protein